MLDKVRIQSWLPEAEQCEVDTEAEWLMLVAIAALQRQAALLQTHTLVLGLHPTGPTVAETISSCNTCRLHCACKTSITNDTEGQFSVVATRC